MTTVRTGIAARNLSTALATALLASCASVPRHPIAPDLPDEANSSCKQREGFVIPDRARPLTRMIARAFDAYDSEKAKHSSAI